MWQRGWGAFGGVGVCLSCRRNDRPSLLPPDAPPSLRYLKSPTSLPQLALINGTLKTEEHCYLCGESGHRQFDCPTRDNTFRVAAELVTCRICGDGGHPTSDCPMKGTSAAVKLDSEYTSFLAELGGGMVPDRPGRPAPPPPPRQEGSAAAGGGGGGVRPGDWDCPGCSSSNYAFRTDCFKCGGAKPPGITGAGAGATLAGGSSLGGVAGGTGRMPLGGGSSSAPGGVSDPCKLYVGFLPPSMNEATLRSLFSPYGITNEIKVLGEPGRGYLFGFVRYADPASAQVGGDRSGVAPAVRPVMSISTSALFDFSPPFRPPLLVARLPSRLCTAFLSRASSWL